MAENPEKKKILIVDDAPENLDILMQILKADYRLVPARSGERALKVAQGDNPPDIILLDVMMPEMDGFEVCRRLKAGESTKEIPVIFVTGHADADEKARGLGLGAADYISKPVDPAGVKEIVMRHIA